MGAANHTEIHLTLHAVLFQEKGEWVAHCLELDLVTSDADSEKAWRDIQTACLAQVRHAMIHDPQFKDLFRPPSAGLTRKMAMGHEEGRPVVLRVNAVTDVTLHRLAA